MIKKFIYWLYLKVVYLPKLKERIKADYPGATVKCRIKDLDKGFLIMDAKEIRLLQKAQHEREWIPDDQLH